MVEEFTKLDKEILIDKISDNAYRYSFKSKSGQPVLTFTDYLCENDFRVEFVDNLDKVFEVDEYTLKLLEIEARKRLVNDFKFSKIYDNRIYNSDTITLIKEQVATELKTDLLNSRFNGELKVEKLTNIIILTGNIDNYFIKFSKLSHSGGFSNISRNIQFKNKLLNIHQFDLVIDDILITEKDIYNYLDMLIDSRISYEFSGSLKLGINPNQEKITLDMSDVDLFMIDDNDESLYIRFVDSNGEHEYIADSKLGIIREPVIKNQLYLEIFHVLVNCRFGLNKKYINIENCDELSRDIKSKFIKSIVSKILSTYNIHYKIVDGEKILELTRDQYCISYSSNYGTEPRLFEYEEGYEGIECIFSTKVPLDSYSMIDSSILRLIDPWSLVDKPGVYLNKLSKYDNINNATIKMFEACPQEVKRLQVEKEIEMLEYKLDLIEPSF